MPIYSRTERNIKTQVGSRACETLYSAAVHFEHLLHMNSFQNCLNTGNSNIYAV